MRYHRYGLLTIAIIMMPILTAWVLQAQAASPRELALAAQATAIATPVTAQGQTATTSQDRQRLAYVGMAADAMANVIDVLQIESGTVLLLPAGTTPGQTRATPGGLQTPGATVNTPTAGGLPATVPTGAVQVTPGTTPGTPVAGGLPATVPTGAVQVTPVATVATPSGVSPAIATVGPVTPGQTPGPAGPTQVPPLLPSVSIARPAEMVDFVAHARTLLRVASDGLNNLDWRATGNRAIAGRIVQVCPNQGSSVEAAENALRNLEGELRRAQPDPVVINPMVMRNMLETHAHLQASRQCLTAASVSVAGAATPGAGMTPGALTTPGAGMTPGALTTPAAATPSTGVISPAFLTPIAPAPTLASPPAAGTTPLATPRAGGVTPVTTPIALTPGAFITPGALATPVATPVAGGESTEDRLNAVDRAIQAIQAQLNALLGGARPTPTATPIR